MGRECFENLPENEVQEIYDLHQRELIQRSKKNFQVLKEHHCNGVIDVLPITRLPHLSYILCLFFTQELLLERADLFYQFRSGPAAAVTQEDILDISDALQEDSRYKNDLL